MDTNTRGITEVAWWPWPQIQWMERKPLETPAAKKTLEDYDIPNARFYVGGNGYGMYYNSMRIATAINEGFVTGLLWGLPVDYSSFLMDKELPNTRQPFSFPLVQTMNQRIIGFMSGISVEAKAEPIGQRAESRREQQYLMASAMAQAAQQGPEVAMVMEGMGISPDVSKAKEFAEGWIDPFQKAMNLLLGYIAERNDYKGMLKQAVQNANVSGLCAAHNTQSGGRYRWEMVDSRYVFYDPKSKRPDMKDAAFCVFFKFWPSLSAMAEAHNLSKGKVRIIEEAMRAQGGQSYGYNDSIPWPNGGPISMVMYYMDGDWIEQGFIDGPNGPELVSVDEKDPVSGELLYDRDKDFIDPPELEMTKDWNGKFYKCFYEVLRYAEFIPTELMPVSQGAEDGKMGDLALAGGVYPLQERDPQAQDGVNKPLKIATWMNIGGIVVAPLTALMAPQRILNQITSDIVWRMSKATMPAPLFDKRVLSTSGGQLTDTIAAYKRGEPIYGDTTHLGGAQNAVQMIGGGLDPNIFRQFELLQQFVRLAEEAVGVFGQNSGGPGPANQLVGVKEIQAQQQQIMYRPMINMIQSLFEQMHQYDAQAGRQFYAQRRWILEDAVGTEAANLIVQSATEEMDQFRLKTEIMIGAEMEREAADNLILMQGGLMDRGLLNAESAGKLLGKSYKSDVWTMVERFTQEAAEAQRQMAEQQQVAAQVGALQEQDALLAQREYDMYNKAMDMAAKSDQTNMKGDMPMLQAQAKAMTPQEQAAA